MKSNSCLLGWALYGAAWGWFCPVPAAQGQGSLTPPGPPGPTMKTLAQIEPRILIGSLPFTINVAGSYYLTTNLFGATNIQGIQIQASHVVLDLNGFALSGAGLGSGVSVA